MNVNNNKSFVNSQNNLVTTSMSGHYKVTNNNASNSSIDHKVSSFSKKRLYQLGMILGLGLAVSSLIPVTPIVGLAIAGSVLLLTSTIAFVTLKQLHCSEVKTIPTSKATTKTTIEATTRVTREVTTRTTEKKKLAAPLPVAASYNPRKVTTRTTEKKKLAASLPVAASYNSNQSVIAIKQKKQAITLVENQQVGVEFSDFIVNKQEEANALAKKQEEEKLALEKQQKEKEANALAKKNLIIESTIKEIRKKILNLNLEKTIETTFFSFVKSYIDVNIGLDNDCKKDNFIKRLKYAKVFSSEKEAEDYAELMWVDFSDLLVNKQEEAITLAKKQEEVIALAKKQEEEKLALEKQQKEEANALAKKQEEEKFALEKQQKEKEANDLAEKKLIIESTIKEIRQKIINLDLEKTTKLRFLNCASGYLDLNDDYKKDNFIERLKYEKVFSSEKEAEDYAEQVWVDFP